MVEIRYNKIAGELTGWWANRFGNHEVKLKNRPGEAIVMLNIPLPDRKLYDWLYDETTKSLIPNPNYIEPAKNRDAFAEIDSLEARIKKLEPN